MICIIFNRNCNNNAEMLLDMFSRDMNTIVLDSGSFEIINKFKALGNVYYCGMLNEAIRIMNKEKSDWITYITSDVIINNQNYLNLINSIKNIKSTNIGSYSPSTDQESKSHHFLKKTFINGIRDVSFNEVFMSIVRSDIMNKVCPINTEINKHGYGIDVYTGYICKKFGFRCVVDDGVEIHHPFGTGYCTEDAADEMKKYFSERTELEL